MRLILLIRVSVVKYQIIAHFRELKDGRLFDRWALIRRVRLFDNFVSRVGAYSSVGASLRWALHQSITAIKN